MRNFLAILALLLVPARAGNVPVDSLTGARHHALELAITGYYAVFLPKDYDPSGKRKYPLCVILHGSGSTEFSHGVGLAADVGLDGIIYIAPRAPYPEHEVFMEHKEPGWDAWPTFPEAWGNWDAPTFPKAEIAGLDAIDQYTDWIGRCVRDARKRYPVEDGKAVVIGHSQGAGFAQFFAVRHPDLVKAYAAYAGSYWRSLESDTAARVLMAAKIHPFLHHSEADSVVPIKQAKEFSAYLDKHGVPYGKAWYPGGDHQYGTQASEDLRQFVSKWCLGKAAPPRKGSLHLAGIRRTSKADSLGLRPGDRIRDYDGKAIRTRDDLKAAVAAASGKQAIKLTVESGGKRRVLTTGPGRLGAWLAER